MGVRMWAYGVYLDAALWFHSVRPAWTYRPLPEPPPAPDYEGTYMEAAALLDLSGTAWGDGLDLHVFAVRWSVLRPHVLTGILSPSEARAMLFPEAGEAWVRSLASGLGLIFGTDGRSALGLIDFARLVGNGAEQQLRAELLVAREYPDE